MMSSRLAAVPRPFIVEWVVTIILLLFGTTTLLQAFVVPTPSMDGTLKVGDHLFVDKLAYAPAGAAGRLLPYTEVRRGDIIVFRYPPDLRVTYVKRAIGVPGDRLRIERKQVFINGRALAEPYVQHIDPALMEYRDFFPPRGPSAYPSERARDMVRDHSSGGEILIPPGEYFAMGDNRDNSADSRYWGLVPRANIIGKPLIIYWSYDAPTERLMSPTPGADHLLDVALHFFTKTRWERTFRLVRGYPHEPPAPE